MSRPTKSVRIGAEHFVIGGVSEADKYFDAICDGFEPDFEQFCRDFVRAGDTCIDIGANIGVKSLLLSQRCADGRVVAIEAGPHVSSVLAENVARSGRSNIAVVSAAVGDRDGSTAFSEDSAYGHIVEQGPTVRLLTLASAMAEGGAARADIVKIDVEGFEWPIMRSALPIFERDGSVIFLEFNSWCLTAFAKVSPLAFAEWILKTFPHVLMLQRIPGQPYLRRLAAGDAVHFLHTNMVDQNTLTDLIVTTDGARISEIALQTVVSAPAVAPRRRGLSRLVDFKRWRQA